MLFTLPQHLVGFSFCSLQIPDTLYGSFPIHFRMASISHKNDPLIYDHFSVYARCDKFKFSFLSLDFFFGKHKAIYNPNGGWTRPRIPLKTSFWTTGGGVCSSVLKRYAGFMQHFSQE